MTDEKVQQLARKLYDIARDNSQFDPRNEIAAHLAIAFRQQQAVGVRMVGEQMLHDNPKWLTGWHSWCEAKAKELEA